MCLFFRMHYPAPLLPYCIVQCPCTQLKNLNFIHLHLIVFVASVIPLGIVFRRERTRIVFIVPFSLTFQNHFETEWHLLECSALILMNIIRIYSTTWEIPLEIGQTAYCRKMLWNTHSIPNRISPIDITCVCVCLGILFWGNGI